jgi:hypothetical protein
MEERFRETPQERRARYLRMAREARELASRSRTIQMREACLVMTQSWLALAADLDAIDESAGWTGDPPNEIQAKGGDGWSISHEPLPRGD